AAVGTRSNAASGSARARRARSEGVIGVARKRKRMKGSDIHSLKRRANPRFRPMPRRLATFPVAPLCSVCTARTCFTSPVRPARLCERLLGLLVLRLQIVRLLVARERVEVDRRVPAGDGLLVLRAPEFLADEPRRGRVLLGEVFGRAGEEDPSAAGAAV